MKTLKADYMWKSGLFSLGLPLFIAGVALLAYLSSAEAQSAGICTPLVKSIVDSDLSSARSFTATRNSLSTDTSILKVNILHDDSAAGTVTRVDMTCVEVDRDSIELTLQDCAVAAGVCTSSDVSWQKTLSGAEDKNWPWRVDVESLQSVKCTISAGAGSGHANDRLDVHYQYCG